MSSVANNVQNAVGKYHGMSYIFDPQVVAVVGASRHLEKWGSRVLLNTKDAGFSGRLYGVNPTAGSEELAKGIPLVARLADIAEPIDLVMVAVPREAAVTTVEEAARHGARAAVIVTAGFGEVGGTGERLESRLNHLVESEGIRIIGPNCFGLYRGSSGLNLTTYHDIRPGPVSIVTQSGNVAIALFQAAAAVQLGIASCIGIGNQLDLEAAELVASLAADPETKAVGLYLEGVPPGGGDRFIAGLEACRAAGKAVGVLKGGRSREGAGMVRTHTRSLAADDHVWDAILADHGAVRVQSTAELMDILQAAVRVPRFWGQVGVVTDGGGDSVMAVDALSDWGLQVAMLSPPTQERLSELIPPMAPRSEGLNPLTLDTPGGVQDDPQLLVRCAEALAADPAVGAIVVAGVFGGYREVRKAELAAARQLLALNRGHVPILVQSAYALAGEEPLDFLAGGDIAVYPTIQRLVAALATRASTILDSQEDRQPTQPSSLPVASVPVEALDDEVLQDLLARYGIATTDQVVVCPGESPGDAGDKVGYPAVLKLSSHGVLHKSDVGGVRLGLDNRASLEQAAGELWSRFPGSPLLVMPHLTSGLELLVGTFSDPCFGPVVVVGRGGIWTEVEADTVICRAPLGAETIHQGLAKLRCYPMMAGSRGQSRLALEQLTNLIVGMGRLGQEHPELSVDLNPVILYPDGYAVADAKALRSVEDCGKGEG